MATHRWLSVSFSLSAAFLPFLSFFSSSPVIPSHFIFPPVPLSVVTSVILSVLDRSAHACVLMLSTEMVSHGHVEGFVSHLWHRKDKDSNNACMQEYMHIHT
ncbi:hypothetical protein XENOCAPTIV_020452 [Xenoophorus captivus]|uniref:Secreted protein n=1 Tax=Xenoophorus captivus TaxID=1517983 RepID=A0ABV0Q5L3_9TELE